MKKQSKIRLTERDLELLNFINNFGFCEIPQLEKRFNLKPRRAYQILNRLIDADLLEHERIFHRKHGIYRLTGKGAKYTELPALHRVSLANYKHDMLMIEVCLKLCVLFPEAQWVSERQLKHDKYFDGLGKKGHLPDAILKFPKEINNSGEVKQVAIEVELTAKSKKRTESILAGYGKEYLISEVWYYCADNVVDFIRTVAARMQFIKVYNLRELLSEEKDKKAHITTNTEFVELNADSNLG